MSNDWKLLLVLTALLVVIIIAASQGPSPQTQPETPLWRVPTRYRRT